MSQAATPAERAGYYIPVNHFTEASLAPRPHIFEAERREVLRADPGPTRLVPLDLSRQLGLPFAATTPTMLASYAVIAADEMLPTPLDALSNLFYVITGSGCSSAGGESVRWGPGDVMLLPVGATATHRATDGPAVLLVVTDAPAWRYLGAQSLVGDESLRQVVHYPAREIARQMASLDALAENQEAVGRAVIFTRADHPDRHATTPFLVSNINTLEPGADQKTHRHNGAALTLCIQGEGCHSYVGDERVDWQPYGVMVTPAAMPHSHHNRGGKLMLSLVVQDTGFYQYAGTSGFAFDPDADLRHRP